MGICWFNKILRGWHRRVADLDADQVLRLAILTDIDRDNRAYYRLGIAPATVGGPDDAAKTLMIASRSKTGDIDVGGFRIAAVIASTLAPRPLLPWLMAPSDLVSTDPAEDSMRQDMVRSARQAGWAELAQIMESFPPAVMEQEDVPVLLASAAGHMWGTLIVRQRHSESASLPYPR